MWSGGGGEVYARMDHLSASSVCSVGGGRGVPDANMISARPRKWITSNRALATEALGSRRRQDSYLMVPAPPLSPQMTLLSDKPAELGPTWPLLKWAQLEFKLTN